jgi:DNA-binding CsgD family transcriptional regulator
LETVRVYTRQRLSELDDPDRVRGRHLAFHVRLAGRAHAGLTGGQPEPWVTRLAADLDDLRAAMDWAAESDDLRGLVDITEPIVRFWFERRLSREMYRRLHDAVEGSGVQADERVRGLTTAALLALGGGEPANAHWSASQAIDAARAAGDVGSALALGLSVRASAGAMSGLSTNEQVNIDIKEAVERAEQCGDAATHAYVLALAGWTLLRSRTIDVGCRLLEEAIEVCEAAEVTFHLPAAHAVLGLWPVWSGRLDRTRHHARRGWELARQVGRPGWEAVGLAGLGAAAVLQGDHERAQDWLSRAQAVSRSGVLEGSHLEMLVRHWLALSAYASGDLVTGQVTAAEIVRIGRGGGSRWDEAIGEWLLGVLAHGQQHHDDARSHMKACRALSTAPQLPWSLGRSSLGLAELAKEDAELEGAWKLAHDGLEVLDVYGDRVGTAAALETIADVAVALGESERSLRLLAASQRFHTDAGIARFPVQADRFDRVRNTAQAALNPTDATACWNAGGELSLADAVAYVRRGRGERQRPQFGWASLSSVERDVVRLVAEGHTNAEIGQRLFISINTVKKHLTHVYAKLDVDGRADLAAEVARRDL